MSARSPVAASENVIELDYDALVAEYDHGLVDKLRGFGSSAACLELWVPDPDVTTSLRNMVEAAGLAGVSALSITVAAATANALQREEVEATLRRLGDVAVHQQFDGWRIEVRAIDPNRWSHESASRNEPAASSRAPASATISHDIAEPIAAVAVTSASAYDAALRDAAQRASHRGQLPIPAAHEEPVAAELDGCVLAVIVDSDTHTVTAARFEIEQAHEQDATDAGALELVCAHAVGLPIQELADHGVLRAAASIDLGERPVPGIALPATLCPAFRRTQIIVRAVRARYGERVGHIDPRNHFDAGPGPTWQGMSDDKRRAVVDRELARFAVERKLAATTLRCVDIQHEIRLTLALTGDLEPSRKPALVMAAETHLRQAVDSRLEVYLTERRDNNSLRRLAIVQDDPNRAPGQDEGEQPTKASDA